MFLSIIIPVFNEEKLVLQVLDKLKKLQLTDFVDKYEVVVVDDCSNDNSYNCILQKIEQEENISLYKHEQNKGKGAAVKTGIKHAKGDIYFIQDADLELSPKDIPSIINAMKELKIEFINGSRYMPGIIRPLFAYKRYLFNKFFTFLTSILINVKLTDMACGYKLIHKNLWDKLSLKENRFGFEAELIIKAMRIKKNNIAEVPVQYFPRNAGEGKKLNNFDGVKIFWTVVKYGLFKMK